MIEVDDEELLLNMSESKKVGGLTQEKIKQRIVWVDIFKALVIISVVVGHTTGKYNMFIYQFHMAAFFYISGYTTNLKKRSVFETIWHRACTILLPFFSIFIVGLLFITCLNKFNLYQYLFSDSFIGTWTAVKQLLLFGNNYVMWMGATWFLLVLFFAAVIQKILYSGFGNRVNAGYSISSIILLILGYSMIGNNITGQLGLFSLDLALIAQFYFFLGVVARDKAIFQNILSKKWMNPLGVLTCLGIMYYFGIIRPTTVDYPSRHFGFVVTDIFAAFNGILLIYFISQLLVFLPAKIKSGIVYIGKNTLGILFFHFMFFNVGYGILVLCNVVPLSYLQNFVPTNEIGKLYWPLFVVIAISLSLLLWELMVQIRSMRIVLGQEKEVFDHCYIRMHDWPLLHKLGKIKYSFKAAWFKNIFITTKQKMLANKFITLTIVSFLILAITPMYSTGIIVNDELQSRFRRMKGFLSSIIEAFGVELSQGRPMRALAAVQIAFSFVSTNIYLYKAVQILTLVSAIALFGYFLYKLFGNKRFSIFTCASILAFLPITFEHAVPNAFICLTIFPMIFLILSLILFTSYVQNKKVLFLVGSMLLFFIAMLGYEFILTFVLLYPIIYFSKAHAEQRDLHNVIKHTIVPVALGMLYLVMMLGSSAIMSTHYSGVQIEFVSLKSSADILSTLFKSSLPGYYLFNVKYEYLFNLYCSNSFPISLDVLNGSGSIDMFVGISILGKSICKYVLENMIDMRILLLLLFFFLLLWYVLPRKYKEQKYKSFSLLTIFVGLAYMIIPAMPNSITKLYQGNVTVNNFTSLPVSIFLYFSAMFTICYLVWNFMKFIPVRYGVPVVAFVICIYCLPVQAMNSTLSEVHNTNYNRLILIEQLFDTATVKSMNNQLVYAPDLYETQNALAVHDTYWSQFAQLKGFNLELRNSKTMQEEPFQIYYQDDSYFVMCGGNEVCVLSPTRLMGIKPVQVSNTEFISATFENEVIDGNFYRYNFNFTQDKSALTVGNNATIPFADMSTDAGTTLKTANIIKGYYDDGWLEKNVEFRIHTGKEGKLILTCYYPYKINGSESGTIYIDGNATPFKITDSNFILELSADEESTVTVKIVNNFLSKTAAPDIRELCFILLDAQGK